MDWGGGFTLVRVCYAHKVQKEGCKLCDTWEQVRVPFGANPYDLYLDAWNQYQAKKRSCSPTVEAADLSPA